MFEAAEVGNKVDKAEYKKRAAKLRVELLDAQRALAASERSLIILVGGVEGAGKSELANLLLSWLDARGVEVHAIDDPSDEEVERPPFWRFWRLLPPAKRSAMLIGSWYTEPIVGRAFKLFGEAAFERRLRRIVEFERMLCAEGVVVVKLWLHLTKKRQKKRLEELEADPDTRWRVSKRDWSFHRRYDRFRKISEEALRRTSTLESPWEVVEAADPRYRSLTAAGHVVEAVKRALVAPAERRANAPDRPKPQSKNILRALDMSKTLDEARYDERVEKLQGRLGELTRLLRRKGRSMTLVFEGADAAGKGGAIRRLTGGMDARLYRVLSVAAPTDEERSHPYLWRFWRALPRRGRVTIYDRSWYGRVLVERVEGFARPEQWRRAYGEINAFEEQLAEAGAIVEKFWLAISPAEQLRRFNDRKETPFKQFKLTPEDWRNRDKWGAYEASACEMIERTSTLAAPWTLVEAEDKRWARVKVLETVVKRLEKELS